MDRSKFSKLFQFGLGALIIFQNVSVNAKHFQKCEFLHLLHDTYKIPVQKATIWTCIADKMTRFNTSIVVQAKNNVSYFGAFQISDEYWCSNNITEMKGCNVDCTQLVDDNLQDDLDCVQKIYEQHTLIANDGFTAWPIYETTCKNLDNNYDVKECNITVESIADTKLKTPKIYEKCEFAQELYHYHGIPMDMIETITCIANEESSFNTAALGRKNKDGSKDHGIFQISDLFWCLNDEKNLQKPGNDCNMSCANLRDDDITDDVRCMKQIYDRTSRFSSSGFDAWTVYVRNHSHCRDLNQKYVQTCFEAEVLNSTAGLEQKKKAFDACELGKELKKQNVPDDQIATYVCIAYFESKFITSNNNIKHKHGIFQIPEGKWCSSNDVENVGCELPCDKLRDTNITDDIQCAQKMHALLGFTAWPSYSDKCKNTFPEEFLKLCEPNLLSVKHQRSSLMEQSISKTTEETKSCLNKPLEVPYYLLHFSDPQSKLRATFEIGKSMLQNGDSIKLTPIESKSSYKGMVGLNIFIENN